MRNGQLLKADTGLKLDGALDGLGGRIAAVIAWGVAAAVAVGILLFLPLTAEQAVIAGMWLLAWGALGSILGRRRGHTRLGMWLGLALGPLGCLIALMLDKK